MLEYSNICIIILDSGGTLTEPAVVQLEAGPPPVSTVHVGQPSTRRDPCRAVVVSD